MATSHYPLPMDSTAIECNISCSTRSRELFFDMNAIRYSAEATTLGAIFLFGVLFNSIVLILFYLRPSTRTFSNRFVLSLTCSHLLQAVFIMPSVFVSSVIGDWIFGHIWCQITGSMTIFLNVASVLSILLIAVDRNCAVNNPLHYSTMITKKKTGLLISGTWILSVLVALPPIFGASTVDFRTKWHTCTILWDSTDLWSLVYGSVLTLVGFVVPLLSVGWIYFTMFKAAKSNSAKSRKNSVTSHFSDVLINIEPTKFGGSQTFQLRKCTSAGSGQVNSSVWCFGGECKAARTGIFVVFSFIICWLPFFLSILSGPYYEIPEWVCFMVTFMAFLSCVVNPYLYVFRNKTSRKLIKKLLECRDCLNKHQYLDTRTLGQVKRKHKRCAVDNSHRSTMPEVYGLHVAKVSPVLVGSHSDIFNTNHHGQKDYPELGESHANLVLHCATKIQIFSINSTRPLLHQDSTSSSEISDIGVCSMLIDNSYNVDPDSADWYGQFQQRCDLSRKNSQEKMDDDSVNNITPQEEIKST